MNKIDRWNQALSKNTTKSCKFCGEQGLTWSQSDHLKTGKWRLFKGKVPHACPKRNNSEPPKLTESEIQAAEKAGKRVYQLKPRNIKNDK